LLFVEVTFSPSFPFHLALLSASAEETGRDKRDDHIPTSLSLSVFLSLSLSLQPPYLVFIFPFFFHWRNKTWKMEWQYSPEYLAVGDS